VVAVAALTLGTATASAETLPATCTNLQTQIDAAAAKAPNHGEGVVVQLNGLCEATNLKTKTGVTVPKGSNFTLEGAPGTTSGFDGKGVTEPMLRDISHEAVGKMTISDLVFQHANVTGAAAALVLDAARLTLSGDSFIENTDQGGQGGALYVDISPGSCATTGSLALMIAASTFRANKLVASGSNTGGAAWVDENCPAATSYLQGNAFEGNTLEVSGSAEMYTGGALTVQGNGAGEAAIPLAQTGNVFDSNRLLATGGPANYGGGGEWLDGMSLTSVGDRFSRNSIPGTTGAHWSWGGGLGILNNSCNEHTPTQSTLENAVVAGNSIGSGLAEDLGGAGIYIGCGPSTSLSNHLSLLDSTVTENTVPTGGVAGIDGGSEDQLVLGNSIVANDVGGSETAGFNGAGGSLTASYSDLCATGSSSSPFTGTGNICANPLLADNGNPASFDVHETGSSPTIDAGSNALVPGGLTTGFFGEARLQSARSYVPPCSPGVESVGAQLYPAVVDIGANEYGPLAVPALAISCPRSTPLTPHSTFAFPASAVRASGVLGLTFKGLGAGKLAVLGTFKVSKTVVSIVKGHRTRRHKLEPVVYGRASYTVSSSGTVKIQLKPTKRALAALKRRKRLQVLLSITFTGTGELPTTHTHTITIKYVKPHPKVHG
jgi:hypothetical protein